MCIIIAKPKGQIIGRDRLEFCWEQNKDGAGYMFADPTTKRLIIRKGLMTFDDFWKAWVADFDDTVDQDVALHFRVMTKGKINVENTHPHRISRYMGMVHNGTLDYFKDKATDEVSDSRILAEFIGKMPNNWWRNHQVMKLLELSIGTNKVVLLNRFGSMRVLNESKGEWNEGCWFSNAYYKIKRPNSYPRTTTTTPTSRYSSEKHVSREELVVLCGTTMPVFTLWHTAQSCKDPCCGHATCKDSLAHFLIG